MSTKNIFPLFETTTVESGWGVRYRGLLICNIVKMLNSLSKVRLIYSIFHPKCWNHVDLVCFIESPFRSDNSLTSGPLFLMWMCVWVHEQMHLTFSNVCVHVWGSSLWNGKITVFKVTIRLGENAERQHYLRDSPNAYVELKWDIKYIKITSWSLWVSSQFRYSVIFFSW